MCISIPALPTAHLYHLSRFHSYALRYDICFSLTYFNLAVSYKAKQSLTIWSSNHTAVYVPNWSENISMQKSHRSFLFFFPELPRWLGQQIVIQPYNGRLFSDKNKWTLQPWKDMEEISIHVDRWIKPIWKGYPPYDSSSMISRKRQNFRERKRVSGCQELSEGKGGMCRWNTGAFKGLKSTVMVGTWSYGVVKTWRLSTESKAWCTQI